jgi:predicted O-methyltransferase YrrM
MNTTNVDQYIKELMDVTQNGKGDSDRHVMTLFTIALSSKAKSILELGVRDGTTTLPLLLAACLNNGRLISVDIDTASFNCPGDLTQFWKFHQTHSISFLKQMPKDEKLNLVYIDDWHSFEHVKKELQYLDNHTDPSSIILLHDLMYGNTEPNYHSNRALNKGMWARGGPFKAVDSLSKNKWEWMTLPWGNGLTILRKKGNVIRDGEIKTLVKQLLRKYSSSTLEKLRKIYHRR